MMSSVVSLHFQFYHVCSTIRRALNHDFVAAIEKLGCSLGNENERRENDAFIRCKICDSKATGMKDATIHPETENPLFLNHFWLFRAEYITTMKLESQLAFFYLRFVIDLSFTHFTLFFFSYLSGGFQLNSSTNSPEIILCENVDIMRYVAIIV